MFDELHHTNVAGQLKRLISRVKAHRDPALIHRKRQALAAVQAFEACGWHPWLIEETITAAGPGRLIVDEAGRLVYEAGADRPGEALDMILAALGDYLEKAGCMLPQEPSEPDELTTTEAADYLGVSAATIRKYVYETGALVGKKRGNTLFFTTAELDRVRQSRPAMGRPRKLS